MSRTSAALKGGRKLPDPSSYTIPKPAKRLERSRSGTYRNYEQSLPARRQRIVSGFGSHPQPRPVHSHLNLPVIVGQSRLSVVAKGVLVPCHQGYRGIRVLDRLARELAEDFASGGVSIFG